MMGSAPIHLKAGCQFCHKPNLRGSSCIKLLKKKPALLLPYDTQGNSSKLGLSWLTLAEVSNGVCFYQNAKAEQVAEELTCVPGLVELH